MYYKDFEMSCLLLSLHNQFVTKTMFMKKVLLAFSIIAASFSAAKAQDNGGFHLAGGVKVGIPAQTSTASFVIGGELQGEYGFAENITGVISAGYTHAIAKSEFSKSSSGTIPVLAGVRFYPSSQFFITGKAGLSFSTATGGGSVFTFEPQVGYNAEKFQGYLSYTGYGQPGSVGIIAATFLYKFN
jgi:hypothetical protein